MGKIENCKPLVSVVIQTYNSSSTIIETLESVKLQTYDEIELLITDDLSQDNTIDICKEWLEVNKKRFQGYRIIETKENTGTAGNANRGVYNASGVWVKTLAGDDLLVPEAIDEYVRFVTSGSERIDFCVSDVEPFSSEDLDLTNLRRTYEYYLKCEHESYKQQYNRIMRVGIFVGPGFFFSKEIYCKSGGCFEQYPFCEEWSLCYNVLKAGIRIVPFDKKLVKYRVSSSSLSHSEGKGLESYRCSLSRYNFFFDYPYKDLIKERKYLVALDSYIDFETLMFCHRYKNNAISRLLRKMLLLFSPYMYYRKWEMFKIIKADKRDR